MPRTRNSGFTIKPDESYTNNSVIEECEDTDSLDAGELEQFDEELPWIVHVATEQKYNLVMKQLLDYNKV